MRLQIPNSPPEITVPRGDASYLISSLCDERAVRYYGRSWALRTEILARMKIGTPSLYALATEYGVSRQYVSKLFKEARAIYGSTPKWLTISNG
jgi:AraC-like DNA-binding protein